MARKLRVGFVGLGRVFDLNVRGYLDHPEAEVAALCDADPAILARRGAEHASARATRDFEDLLRSDLDLIEILTPHPQHEAMTVAALAAGSHVSVQKPMAMTLLESDRMIEAAAASRWRHALAAEGRGGPIVFDHGHHMMAVALWLFGDVRDGFACIERTETPAGVYDAPATLMWRHKDPPVHGTWDVSLALKMTLRTDYYADAERFEIQGEEGIIQVTRCSDRMFDEPVLTLYRDGEVRAFHNLDADWGASFARSTRHFLDVLMGREPEEALTAREGRRVIALYDLFQRSNAERRAMAGSPGA